MVQWLRNQEAADPNRQENPMKYYNVTFKYSDSVYCANIAKAETKADVLAHYNAKYTSVSVSEASDWDVRNAQERGKPVIACPHVEERPSTEITQEDLDEAVSETIAQAAEDEDEETVEKAAKCVGEGNGYYKEEILRKFLAALREAREAVKSGSDLTLRVSDRNNKMGKIPSVSTLPFLTCPSTCRNTCGKICYAAKLANLRPAVLHSYAINTALATLRPDLYWQQVRTVLAVSRFFRFHVSGDIINRAYLDEMISAALSAPHCEILVFTKRYNLVNAWIDENGDLPANLHILFSGWEDLSPVNPHGLPETQVYGRKEEPDPSWLLCGGECSSCACRGLGCWQAKRGDVIAFRKH